MYMFKTDIFISFGKNPGALLHYFYYLKPIIV